MEELQAGFAAYEKELEAEYQKQVDEMYFFGYHCCMKKNDIMHDIPPFPSDDEHEISEGPSRWDDAFFMYFLYIAFFFPRMVRLMICKDNIYYIYNHKYNTSLFFFWSSFFFVFTNSIVLS